jgi:hypothetical protein
MSVFARIRIVQQISGLFAAVYARGLPAVIVLEIKNSWPRNTRARKFCHGKFSAYFHPCHEFSNGCLISIKLLLRDL